jgi:hypothetical protein
MDARFERRFNLLAHMRGAGAHPSLIRVYERPQPVQIVNVIVRQANAPSPEPVQLARPTPPLRSTV